MGSKGVDVEDLVRVDWVVKSGVTGFLAGVAGMRWEQGDVGRVGLGSGAI